MIYLKIAHTNDDDADYFCFNAIDIAVKYMIEQDTEEWIMSGIPFEEMPLADYTFVPDSQVNV